MSLNKSATRRLSLLAGSSLVVASLAVAAFTGAALSPTFAMAADECTPVPPTLGNGPGPVSDDPVLNGTTADSFNCTAATYATGITYDAFGNLTVTKTNTGTTTVTANGVNLTGDGTESLTWDSTIGTVSGGTGTAGPVISVTSTGSGAITVNTAGVSGSAATATHGIYAQSTGAGNIVIAPRASVSASNSTSGVAAIEASSNGGDVTIIQDFSTTSPGVSGRLYGIRLSTTGAGDATIAGTRRIGGGTPTMASTSSAGIAAIEASVGTGLLSIDVVGGVSNSNSTNGIGIRTTTLGGDAIINVRAGAVAVGSTTNSANVTAIESNMSGGTTTINIVEVGVLGSNSSVRRDDKLLRAIGSGTLVVNNGVEAYGTFDLSAFAGNFMFTTSGVVEGWSTFGTNIFAQGADTINNAAGGIMSVGILSGSGSKLQTSVFEFGAGNDTFNNAGTIVVGINNDTNTALLGETLELRGLERFNNSGLIILGSIDLGQDSAIFGESTTDGFHDDVLVMQEGSFHGDEGSRIWVDALLNATGQTSCARNDEGMPQDVAIEDAEYREGAFLVANDCLDFRGSAVSGRTGVIINDVIAGDRGAYNPEGNVLVDVAGSDPADIDPNAFYVAPESVGYSPNAGGVLDKGLFVYAVGYDAEDEAFKIYGVASQGSLQFPLLGQSANDLWRTATSPWLGRRMAQRDAEEGGEPTSRFWVRGALSMADRVVADTVAAGVATLTFDNSYNQDDGTLALGMDLARGSALGGQWVLGAMAGYAQARVNYEASPNTAIFEGGSVGLYGGFTAGPFFHDMLLNATLTNLLVDVPSLQLAPTGTVLESDVTTLGGRMETGWRFGLGPLRIEPLASVSWSQSSFDNMDVPADDPLRFGGEIEFDDARSLRAGLGVRLGMTDVAPLLLPIDFTVTAKAMQEWDGEAGVTIANLGEDAVLSRTFDGAYNEVSVGLSLGEEIGHVAGFINIGGAWGDDYDATNGSLGLRLRW